MKKLLIICGPTATGKTSLGLKLAQKYRGQIISADSRQVYKGMDIGTGKDLPKGTKQKKDGHYLINKIKVWGYDLVKPDQDFSVSHFIKFAIPRIKKIWTEGQLPIIVGGTGLYLKALTQPIDTLNVPANQKLRDSLELLSIEKLQQKLKKLSLNKFQSMNHSDQHNPRRLIRAIEIQKSKRVRSLGPDPLKADQLWLGLKTDKKILDQRIKTRVLKRIKVGAQAELESLIKAGYSWNLPSLSAMGYKQWQEFFENNLSLDKLTQTWELAEKQYFRRQLTWFNKQPNINWFDITNKSFPNKVVKRVSDWYTSS